MSSTYRIIREKRSSACSAAAGSFRVRISSELRVLKRKCGLSLPLILASSARTSAASARAAAMATRWARRAWSELAKPETSAKYANTPHIARHSTRCWKVAVAWSAPNRLQATTKSISCQATTKTIAPKTCQATVAIESPQRRCSQRTHGSTSAPRTIGGPRLKVAS